MMDQGDRQLKPWEVPPGEAYWQALLLEGEWGEGTGELQEPERPPAVAESTAPHRTPSVQERAQDWDADTGAVRVDVPEAWADFVQCQQDDACIELAVVGYNRGGLLVKWNGVTGFVPASQLCEPVPYADEQERLDALAERVGCILSLKVIEVDPARNRLILSERLAQRSFPPDPSILDELNPGDVCTGRITNLCAFGAFVDLGGIEGLVHISEISWGRVSHPADVLDSGQEVEVYVLNVDRELGRVGLSLKRLRPDPWDTVEIRYQVGEVIEGTVTNIVKFGAFVRLEEGLEGLIHASDLAGVSLPLDQVLSEGEIVRVAIMSVEGARHRIGLSLVRD